MLAHFLNHEIRRADCIVGDTASFDNREHFFVCLIHIVDNFDTGFFFKLINDTLINVFAPVVYIELVVFAAIFSLRRR